jgi:hypothetical protein
MKFLNLDDETSVNSKYCGKRPVYDFFKNKLSSLIANGNRTIPGDFAWQVRK